MKHMQRVYETGQAMITMLYIMVIGVLVTTGAVYAMVNNTSVASLDELGLMAHSAAESGIENAILRLIRDPAYVGETVTIASQQRADVSIAGVSPQIITSVGIAGGVRRKTQAAVQYTSGMLTIVSWKDVP